MGADLERAIATRAKITKDIKEKKYPPGQEWSLLRLNGLLHGLNNVGEVGNVNWGGHGVLINRAIYSVYIDCLEQGVGDDARAILHPDSAKIVSQEPK